MPAIQTTPARWTEDAAAYVVQSAHQKEVEQILDRVRQVVLGLRVLEVTLGLGDGPSTVSQLVIEVWIDEPNEVDSDLTQWELSRWKVTTFSPEVNERIVILVLYGVADGRS
jgi:hypothetical protein